MSPAGWVIAGGRTASAGSFEWELGGVDGGAMARRSECSSSQIACSASAVALSCRLLGNASSQAAYYACDTVNSAAVRVSPVEAVTAMLPRNRMSYPKYSSSVSSRSS